MLYAAGKTIIPKLESELKLGIDAPNECSRNSMNFRNQESKSYENGSESAHIKSSLIASDQGEVGHKNASV
jgi:hypothetical protein